MYVVSICEGGKKESDKSDFQSVASTQVLSYPPFVTGSSCFVNNPQKSIFFLLLFLALSLQYESENEESSQQRKNLCTIKF